MKKTLWTFFVLLAAALTAWSQTEKTPSDSEKIVWEKDFGKAQALARQTGHPLLLDFTAPWCKPCKMMEQEFWVNPEVVQAMKPFIAVKVDYDHDRSLVDRYGVSAIPFVAIADPLGNLITFRRGFGSKSVQELNQIFDEMPKDFSALKPLYDAIDDKKDNGVALLQIADSYRNSKMVYLSCDFYKKALKTNDIKNDAGTRERIMVTLGSNYYALKFYDKAAEYFEDYMKEFPTGKNRELAISVLAISDANLNKPKDAVKYLEMLKTEFPASKNISNVTRVIESYKKYEK